MVDQGWALVVTQYSSGYVMQESAARGGKRWMSAEMFEKPWEIRGRSRRAALVSRRLTADQQTYVAVCR